LKKNNLNLSKIYDFQFFPLHFCNQSYHSPNFKLKLIFSLLAFCILIQTKGQTISLFSNQAPITKDLKKWAKKGKTALLNSELSKLTYLKKSNSLKLNLPLPEGETEIDLIVNEIHASDFKVLNSRNQEVNADIKAPVHYKGKNNKRGLETVALSIFPDGEIVVIISNGQGNINIARLPDSLGKQNEYVIFNDKDLVAKNPFQCLSEELADPREHKKTVQQNPNAIQDDTSCRLTEIYWECDHDMFQKGGNSIQGALNRFEAMFNGTAVLYETENINIGVKIVKVWDTPDPYNYSSSFTALGDFQDAGNAANWPGQLAHLLSTRNLSLGGVAFLSALCSSFRYGFSNIDFLFAPLPTYSWTLSTIAHELGHNFSSPHTHNCNWEVSPGVFGQIDSCWNAEGDCQPTIKGRTGTIMSYCHLTGNVNLSLGFGPLPGNRIREAYANMPCVSGTIVIPNFTPITSGQYCIGDTVQLSAESLAGYNYTWSGPNGFTSTLRDPILPNATAALEGIYGLKVKKASCESREKKVELVFNCMKVGSLPISFCAGSNISVPFSSTGVFNPGNQFITQLSNVNGSFANPINLDTLLSDQPQTVNVSFPFNLTLGNGYRIRFISTNPSYTGKPNPKSFIINPIGNSPTPQNAERCGPGSVQIGVSGGSNITWYSDAFNPEPIAFSRRYNTPLLTQTKSYFAQSGLTNKDEAGLSFDGSGDNSNTTNGLKFNAISSFRLDSIQLVHEGIQGKFCVLVAKKNGLEIYRKQVFGTGPNSKIPLFWRFDVGTDYELTADSLVSVPLTFGNMGTRQYPITTSGIVSITGPGNGNNQIYPYFFDWVVSKFSGCPSKRVEVIAAIKPGTVPETPTLNYLGTDSLEIQQTGIQYQWLVNGQLNSAITGRKIRGLLNSSFQVRYRIDSCWSEWSEAKVFLVTSAENEISTLSPIIFPNPNQGLFYFEPINGLNRVVIFNSMGKKILQKSISKKENLDISAFPSGIYFLEWTNQKSKGQIKIVRE